MGQNSGHNQPVFIILLFFLLFPVAAAGEDTPGREAGLFNRGYESYLSYKPESAVEEFSLFLREFPDSSARDAALYWLGKSYMQLKSFGEARKVFEEIRKSFKESPYVPYAESELEILSRIGGDALPDVPDEVVVRNGSPEKRLREAEKQVKSLGKELKEAAEERDRVKIRLSEEREKAEILRDKVTEIEKKEKRLSDITAERDGLRKELDAVMKQEKDSRTSAETCQDEVKKMLSREQGLKESIREKEVLEKQLDEERKITAELRAKNRDAEKREKTIRDLIAERDSLKTASEEQNRQIGEFRENLKVLADRDRAIEQMTRDKDALSIQNERQRDTIEALSAQVDEYKDIEKKYRTQEKLLQEALSEKDALKGELSRDRKIRDALEKSVRELENSEEKALLKEKELLRVTDEREVLAAQLDAEKEQGAALGRRVAELEKQGGALRDIREENTRLKKEVGQEKANTERYEARIRDLEQKEEMLAETVRERDSLRKELEMQRAKTEGLEQQAAEAGEYAKTANEEKQVLAQRTQERDTLSKMLGEERKKREDLEQKIREMENACNTSSRTSGEEGELRGLLEEERKKTAEFVKRIQELEDKEQLVADLIRERDTLKSRLGGENVTGEGFGMRSGAAGPAEKIPLVTAPKGEEPDGEGTGELSKEQAGVHLAKAAAAPDTEGDDRETVLALLGIQTVPWRTGVGQEDAKNEEALYEKARTLGITGETEQFRKYMAQHTLNAEQQDALRRFFAVSEYVDQRLNRLPEESTFESLSVRYDEDNRYTKIVLARELQEKAKEGMSFEDIRSLYPDMIRYQEVPYEQLDIHIREKISNLPYGQVGVLWSEEGYMILKPVLRKLSYDPFRDSSSGMQERIRTLVRGWLQEMNSP